MVHTHLSRADRQLSVLGDTRAYPPYGALTLVIGHRLAYCGQMREPGTGTYHLGNGHRVFNPRLMRFCSSDRLSPFGKGGINTYAYCQGDPVNYHDRDGRAPTVSSVTPALDSTATSSWSWLFEVKNLQFALPIMEASTATRLPKHIESTMSIVEYAVVKKRLIKNSPEDASSLPDVSKWDVLKLGVAAATSAGAYFAAYISLAASYNDARAGGQNKNISDEQKSEILIGGVLAAAISYYSDKSVKGIGKKYDGYLARAKNIEIRRLGGPDQLLVNHGGGGDET